MRCFTRSPTAGPSRPQESSNISEHDSDSERDEPGPPLASTSASASAPTHDASQEFPPDEDEEGDDAEPQFPITHSLTLKSHTKPVSALTLDASGARVVSGAHDYDVKLWDFGGMTASGSAGVRPFKSWEPAGSYHVRAASAIVFSARAIAEQYAR